MARSLSITGLLLATAAFALCAETQDDAATVAKTLEQFHAALAHGDDKAAMTLLAPDAVILESGSGESRSQYEAHHLPEDIMFAKAVQSTRSDIEVHVDGNTAWLTSRSRAEGSFEGKAIKSSGVELAVLTRTADGWRIRAIHWSSHRMP